jgi:hypothetical protein
LDSGDDEKEPKRRETRIVWAISEFFLPFFVVFFITNKCFILYTGIIYYNGYDYYDNEVGIRETRAAQVLVYIITK